MDRPHLSLLKPETPAKLQKLLDFARNYPCAHCGRNDGTIVACHSNELALGRGFGKKTPDYYVAYLCSVCHDHADGRAGGLTLEEKRELWRRAYIVTVGWWFRDSIVVVK